MISGANAIITSSKAADLPIAREEAAIALQSCLAHEAGFIAVSGGPDSMALMALMADQLAQQGRNLSQWHVGVVDHGLRPKARHEAEIVVVIASSLGFATAILEAQKITKNNRQASARSARYDAIWGYMAKHSLPVCLTAHHLGDQTETVLMRLFRGSGLNGLSGMKGKIQRGKFTLIRPLLAFSKQRLMATAIAHKFPYFEDPSNLDQNYDRTRMRNLMETATAQGFNLNHLNTSLGHLKLDADFITQEAESWWDHNVQTLAGDAVYFRLDRFQKLHNSLKFRILQRAIALLSPGEHCVGLKPLKMVVQNISNGLETALAKVRIYAWQGHLYLSPEFGRRQYHPTQIDPENHLIWDYRFEIGKIGHQNVSCLNLLIEAMPLKQFGINRLRDILKGEKTSSYLERLNACPPPVRETLLVLTGKTNNCEITDATRGNLALWVPSLQASFGLEHGSLQDYLDVNPTF